MLNSGDTAWVLLSGALVVLMTPGVGFFYAGMVRAKNALSVLVQTFACVAIVTVVWIAFGFSIAFGPDVHGVFGDLTFAGLSDPSRAVPGHESLSIPVFAFCFFQLAFAIITPALFTGAIAERTKFSAFLLLSTVWSILVYAPVAHWVFSPNGWLAMRGAQDFAGGAVVHINSGAAALALALVLGRRKDWPSRVVPVHNLPLVLLGTAMLLFGWFGFNAGSALKANETAAIAAMNTIAAAASAFLSWIVVERIRGGRVTALGSASGIVAGLVAVTPAAGFVSPVGALGIGLITGVICNFACGIKFRFGFDDALDVIGVHLVGGIFGAVAIGFVGNSAVGGRNGLFYGGGVGLLAEQALSAVAVFVYSLVATFVISKAVQVACRGLRVNEQQEDDGLDLSQHGEVAYDFGYGTGTAGGGADEAAITAGRIESFEEHRLGRRPVSAEERFGVHFRNNDHAQSDS